MGGLDLFMLFRISELFCITPATLIVAVHSVVQVSCQSAGFTHPPMRKRWGRKDDNQRPNAHICICICICTELSMTFPFSIFSFVLRARTFSHRVFVGR